MEKRKFDVRLGLVIGLMGVVVGFVFQMSANMLRAGSVLVDSFNGCTNVADNWGVADVRKGVK